jgi:hypothetical protein
MFEINDPVGTRTVIIKTLEANEYKVKQNTLPKIVAQHQLSLTRNPHKIEIEFDPPTNQCILTTVTLRIEHNDCKDYMKAVVGKLAKVLPNMKITSVKPKMSLRFKGTANVAKSETVHCKQIEAEPSGWRCQYCGFENAVGLDRCKKCGMLIHSLIDPEEPEITPISEDTEDSVEE